jgi:hypothetical protein
MYNGCRRVDDRSLTGPLDNYERTIHMSSFSLPSRGGISEHTFAQPLDIKANMAVLRSTGIVALMGIVVIHLVQVVPTMQAMPMLGVAYLSLIAGAVVVGARLVIGGRSQTQLWAPVALLGAAAIAGYVFTRLLSTPLDHQDVANWSCMLGLAALFVEAALVAMSLYAISMRRHIRPASFATRNGSHPLQTRPLHVGASNGSAMANRETAPGTNLKGAS